MASDNRTSMKIVDEVHAQHNDRRKRLGLSWSEYLRRCDPPGEGDGTTALSAGANLDTEALAAELRQDLGFDGDPTNLADADALAEAIADRVAAHVRQDPEVLAREVARQMDYAAIGSEVSEDD